jgi:hypothetical protein
MPSSGMLDSIRYFLSWDPLDTDWRHIAYFVDQTKETAHELQTALKNGSAEEREDALKAHVANIGSYLVDVAIDESKEWLWWIVKFVVGAKDLAPTEVIDEVQEAVRVAPHARSAIKRMLVVNTLRSEASKLL